MEMIMECVYYSPLYQDKLDTFFEKVFKSNGFLYDPGKEHNDLRNINKIFVDSGGGFWILKQNDFVVGTVGLKIIDNVTRIAELKCLYVLPEFQGKGLGQVLIAKMLLESKQRNLNKIRLDVKIRADKAIKLYRKNGFYDIERYNGNKKSGVVFMEKII
jgi:ribosomal protein S18 acetylase RimI-like enzyme